VAGGVDSHSSQLFHHTSGGRKTRPIFLLKSDSKAENGANFFKVFFRLFYKEKYPAISDIRAWIYRLGESHWSRCFPFFSMKRSDGRYGNRTFWLWLDLRITVGVIALLLGGICGGNAILEMDLASGWSRGAFLNLSKFALYRRWAYFQPRGGLFFRCCSVIIESIRLVGFGFAAYMIFLFILAEGPLQKLLISCDRKTVVYGHWEWCSCECLSGLLSRQNGLGYTGSLCLGVALAMIPCRLPLPASVKIS